MIGLVVALGAAASPVVASTTSVFYDDDGNLSADPDPFGGGAPTGTSNTAVGVATLADLTSGGFTSRPVLMHSSQTPRATTTSR
jgi:hypothetical protein